MANPHDLLFKRTFSDPAHAVGVLTSILPPPLVQRLDLTDLRLETGSFVDQALTERHSDLLYSAPIIGGRRALLYLLFEHQSRVDPMMAYRLLRYMVRIWEHWLKLHPRSRKLPVVVPVVLYHGPRPWKTSRRLSDLFGLEEPATLDALPFIPEFQWQLDDLSIISSAQLRARSLTALGGLVLNLLKNAAHVPDLAQELVDWAGAFKQVIQAPDGLATLEALIRYIAQVSSPGTLEELEEQLGPLVGQEFEETVMTAAQELIQRGRQQGFEEGVEEGIEKGIEQGEARRIEKERHLLLRLIQQRFGGPTPEAVARVEAADGDQLSLWIENILVADSVGALLALSSAQAQA